MITDSGYVLHKTAWQDSSELIRLLTRNHGRVDVVAKGSKRRQSAFYQQLHPFLPTELSFTGRGSLQTLTMAEQTATHQVYPYINQVSMLYCNELMLLITLDEVTAKAIFPVYEQVIKELKQSSSVVSPLRHFEWSLSRCMGYQLEIPAVTDESATLMFDPMNGLIVGTGSQSCPLADLEAFIRHDELNQQQWQQISRLMRQIIQHLVHGKPIKTRQLLM
jgi:DNA repair protein RecO (recombination protein O)